MDPNTTVSTNNSPEIPSEIRSFLESLLKDANMLNIDEAMKEEMLKELYVRLDNHIITSIIDNLPPDQMETFIQMNEQKRSQSEIQQFLLDKIPNAQEIMALAFSDFRNLYLGNIAVAQNAGAVGESQVQS